MLIDLIINILNYKHIENWCQSLMVKNSLIQLGTIWVNNDSNIIMKLGLVKNEIVRKKNNGFGEK
jgi:hypothetical protein